MNDNPNVGDRYKDLINVGACVGRVSASNEETVTVSGIYYYWSLAVEAGAPPEVDNWSFVYKKSDFDQINYDDYSWDARDITPIEYTSYKMMEEI